MQTIWLHRAAPAHRAAGAFRTRLGGRAPMTTVSPGPTPLALRSRSGQSGRPTVHWTVGVSALRGTVQEAWKWTSIVDSRVL